MADKPKRLCNMCKPGNPCPDCVQAIPNAWDLALEWERQVEAEKRPKCPKCKDNKDVILGSMSWTCPPCGTSFIPS